MTLNLLVELVASMFTLGGMYVGSTTLLGACLYLTASFAWIEFTRRNKAWGLMPLNVAGLVIAALNIWKAL